MAACGGPAQSSAAHLPLARGGLGCEPLWLAPMPHSCPRPVKVVVSATLTRDPSKLQRLELHCPRSAAGPVRKQRGRVAEQLASAPRVCVRVRACASVHVYVCVRACASVHVYVCVRLFVWAPACKHVRACFSIVLARACMLHAWAGVCEGMGMQVHTAWAPVAVPVQARPCNAAR